MSNYAPESFRPFMGGENRQGTPIREGSYDSAPYWNGIRTAAENFNHILAFAQKPIINQVGGGQIVYSGSSITFAKYVVWVPRLYSRTKLRVRVTATTTGGTTFTVSGSVDGGATASSSATSSGSTAVLDVVTTTDAFGLLTLTFVMSANATLTITRVVAFSMPEAISGGNATLPDVQTMCSPGGTQTWWPSPLYTPQDTSLQYREGFPLSVAMMGDMQLGLQAAFRDLVSPLVNWSVWDDHSTLTTANKGARIAYASTIPEPVPFCQYVYFPRAGVQKVRVFVAARVTAGSGEIQARWRGSSLGTGSTTTVSATTTDFSLGNWAVWNVLMDVPQVRGPLFLDIRGAKGSSGTMYVQSVAVFEDNETIQ